MGVPDSRMRRWQLRDSSAAMVLLPCADLSLQEAQSLLQSLAKDRNELNSAC